MWSFVEMLLEYLILIIKKLSQSNLSGIQENIGKEICFAKIEENKQTHLQTLFMLLIYAQKLVLKKLFCKFLEW